MQLFRVVGPPGTGKTRSIATQTARAIDKYGPRGVVVCSLTRAAALEAAGRVALPRQQVGTLHSLCYHALDRPTIAESKLAEWNAAFPALSLEEQAERRTIDEPVAERLATTGDTAQAWIRMNILRAQCIPQEKWPPAVQRIARPWQTWKRDTGYLDFTDLLEQAPPVAPGMPRVLFIDEAQDLSRLETRLVERWATHTDTTVYYGDPYQCLYSFRGSNPLDAFPEHAEYRVLRQSYRVPRAVHARCLGWIAQSPGYRPFDYLPREDEGLVEELVCAFQAPGRLIEYMLAKDGSVMFQATCAYMLQPLIAWLRARGIPYANPWRATNGRWNPLAVRKGLTLGQRLRAFLRPWLENAPFWDGSDVAAWSSPMEARGTWKRGTKSQMERMDANTTPHEVLDALKNSLENPVDLPTPVQPWHVAVQWWAQRLLPKYADRMPYLLACLQHNTRALIDPPRVYLGTIHSLKGSEADHVAVWSAVSDHGWREWDETPGSTYRQFYVAMTRAKKSLTIARGGGKEVPL